MSDSTVRVIALILSLTFAWAAVAKVARWKSWRRALDGYGLPGALSTIAAPSVPLAEAGVAALLLAGATRVGAAACLSMLASFSAAVVFARVHRGQRLPCGCFGRATDRDYRAMLARNALLGLLAGALLVTASDLRPVSGWSAPSVAEVVPAVLVGLGVAAIGWTLWQARSLFEDPRARRAAGSRGIGPKR